MRADEFETIEQRTKKLDLRYIKPKRTFSKKLKYSGPLVLVLALTFFFAIVYSLQPTERAVPTKLSFLSEPPTQAKVSQLWSYLVTPSDGSAYLSVETSIDWGLTISGWTLSGTPKYWSIGLYEVELTLSNGAELAWQNFSVEVSA